MPFYPLQASPFLFLYSFGDTEALRKLLLPMRDGSTLAGEKARLAERFLGFASSCQRILLEGASFCGALLVMPWSVQVSQIILFEPKQLLIW